MVNSTLAEHVAIITAQFDRLGLQPPIDADAGARILLALDHGFALLGLLDPKGFPPGLWGDSVEFLNEAALALVEKRQRESGDLPS